jgi:hypothetical protein
MKYLYYGGKCLTDMQMTDMQIMLFKKRQPNIIANAFILQLFKN